MATKSTTKYYKFRGKVSYAKVYEPDEYKGERKWKLNLYPNPDVIAKMKAAGLQNKWKDDDGEKSGVFGKFVGLSRPCEKEFESGLTRFLPPEILDANGDKIVSYKQNEDGSVEMFGEKVSIGNGSEIEVELEVYETKRFGKGSKFVRVRIIDLIEYIPPEDVSDNEVDEENEPEVSNEELTRPAPEVKKETRKSTKVSW